MAGPALRLLPPDAGDRGSQRCRLGPRALAALGLKLGSPVRICLPGGAALCAAWPRRDRAEGFLQLDTKCVSPWLVGRPCQGLSLGLGHLQPLSCVKLRRVRVRAVLETGAWGLGGESKGLVGEYRAGGREGEDRCLGGEAGSGTPGGKAGSGTPGGKAGSGTPGGKAGSGTPGGKAGSGTPRGEAGAMGVGGGAGGPGEEARGLGVEDRDGGREGEARPGTPGRKAGARGLGGGGGRPEGEARVVEGEDKAGDLGGKVGAETGELLKELLRGVYLCPGFVVELAAWPGLRLLEVTAVEPELEPGSTGFLGTRTRLEVVEVLRPEQFQSQGRDLRLGGLEQAASPLRELLSLPLRFPKALGRLGLPCPRGVLLLGPPGVGKTALLRALAHELEAPILEVSPAAIQGSRPGESEQKLRRLFEKAQGQAGPCLLFIDDMDSLFPRRAAAGNRPEDRLVAQLLTLMDSLDPWTQMLVVAASSRPEALEPALRRPGRFDREITINVPTMLQRQSILQAITSAMPLRADVYLSWLAEATSGYVGADLTALCREATLQLVRRSSKEPLDNKINFADFHEALRIVQPSCLRSSIGLTDFRPVQWDQIGGLDQVKLKLKQSIEWPVMYPEAFVRMGVTPIRGILLYGPPGCAKTTVVKAAASSCRCSFLSVSGADLFSPFVGDSEKALAQVFHQARAAAPSILFLDEIDSMLGSRSLDGTVDHSVKERVLSVLLNEMDGIGHSLAKGRDPERKILLPEGEQLEQSKMLEFQEVRNKDVIVVAATNRPDLLDDALLRPGRFDQIIFVPIPDAEARLSILRICTSKTPLDDVLLEELAAQTTGFTGADIQNLCKEAALLALQEDGFDAAAVKHGHFLKSLQNLKPSLTGQQLDFYHNLFSTVTRR